MLANDTFQRIMWVELYGFDLRCPDLGVKKFFSTAGFVPDKIMLFIWNPDFIHTYRIDQDPHEVMRPDYGAYYGRPYGENFSWQPWCFGDLKRLIKEIHNYGVKVFLSVLDQIMVPMYAERFGLRGVEHQWADDHPEILYLHISGERVPFICPWKRFEDGSYYEDFFIRQLRAVIKDYDFDGFHGADGYGHPRFSIFTADLSNDIVEQYGFSPDLPIIDESECRQVKERAETLWNNHRESWSRFWCGRHRDFWLKAINVMHADKREVILNTCWTRGPLESIYRYGIDYSMLQSVGVDGWVVEAPACVQTSLSKSSDGCDELYKYSIMLADIRASLPTAKLYLLNALKDSAEQYCIIRSSPPLVESDIYGFAGVNYSDEHGKCRRALDGVLSCLSDGLMPHEWEFWRSHWQQAVKYSVTGGAEIVAVYSDEAAEEELSAYFRTPFVTSYRWLFTLLNSGAPLSGRIAIDGLKHHVGPVLVVNPIFFSSEQLKTIRKSARGKIFFVGLTEPVERQEKIPFLNDSWLLELPEPEINEMEINKLVMEMNQAAGAPCVIAGKCHASLKYYSGNKKILTVRNDCQYYQHCKIMFNCHVKNISSINRYISTVQSEPYEKGTLLSLTIPSYAVLQFEIE